MIAAATASMLTLAGGNVGLTRSALARAAPVTVRTFLVTSGVPSKGQLSAPAISGNVVVWMQTPNGRTLATGAIYGKNLRTGHMFPVTPGPTALSNPAISGSTVVWLDCRSCSLTRDAMGYITYHHVDVDARDLATGQTRRIATLADAQPAFYPPTIRGRIVLWWERVQRRYAEYGLDLATGRVFPITHPAKCGRGTARLDENTVVWLNTHAVQRQLCATDLATGRTSPIPVSPDKLRYARDVESSDNAVIWTDWDSNQAPQPAAIYGIDVLTGRVFHVTTIPYGHFNPQLGPATAVSGRLVLWEASGKAPFTGDNAGIYGYDTATGQRFQIHGASPVQRSFALSGTTVVWLDYRGRVLSIRGASIAV